MWHESEGGKRKSCLGSGVRAGSIIGMKIQHYRSNMSRKWWEGPCGCRVGGRDGTREETRLGGSEQGALTATLKSLNLIRDPVGALNTMKIELNVQFDGSTYLSQCEKTEVKRESWKDQFESSCQIVQVKGAKSESIRDGEKGNIVELEWEQHRLVQVLIRIFTESLVDVLGSVLETGNTVIKDMVSVLGELKF